MTREEFLVFGRDRLRQIEEGAASPMAITLFIELETATEELEKLVCLVQLVKGHHDYGITAS
jgi:hypothetical protein